MKTAIVIPARLESTRLPRKLLLRETGKSVLQHTYESALNSELADRVIVAVDHDDLAAEVTSFGGQYVVTSAEHQSGTDRVAEAAASIDAELIVNVQADEPEIAGSSIDKAFRLLLESPSTDVSTLATPIRQKWKLEDPSCVKVVFDASAKAMYFSRSPIPHARKWSDELLTETPANFYQHVGLYGYRKSFLQKISDISRTRIEQIESLEQLRFLHAGFSIGVAIIDQSLRGIDTAEDYAAFVRNWNP